MPGRQGNDRKTIQNLKIVQKRPEDNVILVSGAVPGAKGGYVVIRPSKKKEGPIQNLKAGANAAAAAPATEEGGES
jgi:ribosomal protein L3